jgi:hypothetical protein
MAAVHKAGCFADSLGIFRQNTPCGTILAAKMRLGFSQKQPLHMILEL